MFVLGPEITTVLFAHGNTSTADTAVIANVMQMFAIVLIPYAVYQLMLRVFYSLGDTRTPALICLVAVGVNIGSALIAYNVLPTDKIIVGIAGGFGLAQTSGAIVSWLVLRRRLNGMDGRRIFRSYAKLAAAGLPTAIYAYCIGFCFGPEDAARLYLRTGTEVLYVLRVRGLDGERVLVERTVYADWIASAVERIEPDCESVTQRLYEDTGLVFAYGEHLIDAVAAGTADAELLGVRRTRPLLRVRRVTTTQTGRPVEWSDDRYRSDAINFSIHNSIGSNPLARQAGPGLGAM